MDEINNNFPVQNPSNPNGSEQTISLNLNISDVKSLAGWGAFMAIIDIIFGALACITVIGASYGVTQIIAGTKLFTATDNLKRYIATNNHTMISETLYNMSKYFKLRGITTIVKISLTVVIIFIYILAIIAIVSNDPDYFNRRY